MSTEKSSNANSRLEAFSDGVFAIAVTLLVLEIKIPPVSSIHSVPEFWHHILGDWPSWFGFALSFIIILVAWHAHHSTFKLLNRSSARFIYANAFLMFTVAAFPFTTGLMAEYMLTDFAQPAITVYCFSILLHNISWFFICRTIMHPVPLIKDEAQRAIFVNSLVKNNRNAFFLYLGLTILSLWLPFVSMIVVTASWAVWVVVSINLDPKNGETD